MATTISSTCGGFTDEFDREGLELLAQAVNTVNRVAKLSKGRSIRSAAYDAKAVLLSRLIELDTQEVDVTWQQQPNGDSLILVKVCEYLAVHVPFDRLSPTARCKIVQRIGPGCSAAA